MIKVKKCASFWMKAKVYSEIVKLVKVCKCNKIIEWYFVVQIKRACANNNLSGHQFSSIKADSVQV